MIKSHLLRVTLKKLILVGPTIVGKDSKDVLAVVDYPALLEYIN
jgi:hypothetical protein